MTNGAIDSSIMSRLYSILGLKVDCSQEQIRSAYRKLAKIHHPDIGGDAAGFYEIKNAYDTLSDPQRRRQYDLAISGLPFAGEPYKTVVPVIIPEPVDVFDDLVDILMRRAGMSRTVRIRAILPINRNDAENGVNLELLFPMEMICDRCFGFGGTIITVCRKCSGTGTVKIDKRIYAQLEKDSRDGDVIVARSGGMEVLSRIKIQP